MTLLHPDCHLLGKEGGALQVEAAALPTPPGFARGLGAPVPDGALGYVHVPYALALALPAVVTARLGVGAAHRVHVKWVRWAFAGFAGIVAVRLLWNALA